MGSCIAQRLTTHKLFFFNDFGKGDKSQEDDLNRNILEVSRIKNLKTKPSSKCFSMFLHVIFSTVFLLVLEKIC